MKFFLILLSLISCTFLYAQKETLERYPLGQDFYVGGIRGINTEIVKVFKEQNFKPCENKSEIYEIPILVNENASINFVKDFDTITIEKNKCAYLLSRKIIPHLKNWLPARENNRNIAAIAWVKIQPFFMFHSKENPTQNVYVKPTFKKGMKDFSYQVSDIFKSRVKKNENKNSAVIFLVTENGDMKDFQIEGNYSDNEKRDLIRNLSKMYGKWNPATFNGVPYQSKIRQPIRQEFDIQSDYNPFLNTDNKTRNGFR